MTKKIILTGIQPSGALHLGNYFGAIQPIVELAGQGQVICFVADYHALTSITDATALRRNVFDAAATLLACGLDPAQTILFRQSDVPEVQELTWLLSVVTPMGDEMFYRHQQSLIDEAATTLAALLQRVRHPHA